MTYQTRLPQLYLSLEPAPDGDGVYKEILMADENGTISWSKINNDQVLNDVQAFATTASFPIAGLDNTLYIAKDSSLIYRWNGSAYVNLAPVPANVLLDSNTYTGANKQITFSNTSTTDGHNMEVVIQANKRAILRLIADNDNVGETITDSPMIVFSQDGGTNYMEVGLNSTNQCYFNILNNDDSSVIYTCGGSQILKVRFSMIECSKQVSVPDGSASNPGIRFTNYSNTGICVATANQLGLVGGGTIFLQGSSSIIQCNKDLNTNGNRIKVNSNTGGVASLTAGECTVTGVFALDDNTMIFLQPDNLFYNVSHTERGVLVLTGKSGTTFTVKSYRNDLNIATGDQTRFSWFLVQRN